MNAVAVKAGLARGLGLAREGTAVLALFASTIFLSALLLFSVQPIVAKMILPKLGGSPSVWAVSMCFFQAVLLAGYSYAHVLNRCASRRLAPLAHLIVIGVAVLALPFGLPASADELPSGNTYLWLIGVLAATVGLPFFALSANAPLLQAWFARTGHPHATDPYFLYGASNLGSLVALLAYPVAIEPMLALSRQTHLWSDAFQLLSFLIAASALAMLAARPHEERAAVQEGEPACTPAIGWINRGKWIGLAFVPSGLLVAFTSYLTTDIASAPLLWVVPLAIFLATFILVFRDRPAIPHGMLLSLQPLAVTLVVLGLAISGKWGWLVASLAGFAAFFTTAMVCHKELYDCRPQSSHLTEFYLWMSVGGVLGGVFAAILAPQIFTSVYEYPLLLVLGMLCRPGLGAAIADRREAWAAGTHGLASLALIVLLAVAARGGLWSQVLAERTMALVVLGCGVLMLLASRRPLRLAGWAGAMGLAVLVLPSAMNRGYAERSFFGVHRVTVTADSQVRLLMHGTTLHGAQRIADSAGRPVQEPIPATYYHADGPMARGVQAARAASGRMDGGLAVAIVGLGTGSLACYARRDEAWRFFEIDPVVVGIARDNRHFDFLPRCRPDADVVVGDARLTLAREPSGRLDYLVIDAFSSDSVPVHLLTREAIGLYLDKLAPSGILALHVSNRHLDLARVAVATSASWPGVVTAVVTDRPGSPSLDRATSQVVFVSRSGDSLRPLATLKGGTMAPVPEVAPWTDDYSDILTAIWRNYTRHRN